MVKTAFRCPSCKLVLAVPETEQRYIRCPCDTILMNPNRTSFDEHSGISQKNAITKSNFTDKQPPKKTEDNSRPDCERCGVVFTVLKRRPNQDHCRNCGALVCGRCSGIKWPASMIPSSYNYRNEKFVRICSQCHLAMERFRNYCLQGDMKLAERIYNQNQIHVNLAYTIFPHALFPIHCAANSGSIELLRWFLAVGCDPHVKDARGWTVFHFAAHNQHIELMNFLIVNKVAEMSELTDVHTLQNCLIRAFTMLQGPSRLVSSSISCDKGFHSCAPVPSSQTEEVEQLKIALAASRIETGDLTAAAGGFQSVEMSENPCTKKQECVVCFENTELNTVFVPCGHTCCCEKCASLFMSKECPVCRKFIEQAVKTFSLS